MNLLSVCGFIIQEDCVLLPKETLSLEMLFLVYNSIEEYFNENILEEKILITFLGGDHEVVTRLRISKKKTIKEMTDLVHAMLVEKSPDFGKEIPRDCFRIRRYKVLNSRVGRVFRDENITLKKLGFFDDCFMLVERKEIGHDWVHEVLKLQCFVSVLFHNTESFANPIRLEFPIEYCIRDVKEHFVRMFKNVASDQPKNVDVEHVALYEMRPTKGVEELIEYLMEDNDKNIETDCDMKDNALLYVELFEGKRRGKKMLIKDFFFYELRYNLQGKDEETEKIVIEKTKTILDLKKLISEKIELSVNDFRLLNRRNNRKEYEVTRVLRNTNLYTGCAFIVEVGKPLGEKDIMVLFYEYIPLKSVQEIEAKEKEEQKEQQEENKMEKEQKEEIKKEKLIEEINNEGNETLVLSGVDYYKRRKQFAYKLISKMVVNEDEKLGAVKIRLSKKITKKCTPNQLRFRKDYYFGFGKILKNNEKKIVDVYPEILIQDFKRIIIQFVEEEELLEIQNVFRVIQWKPSTWEFGEETSIIIEVKEMLSKAINDVVCEKLKIEKEKIHIHIFPKGTEVKKQTIAFLDWGKTAVDEGYKIINDDSFIIYCFKDEKNKYDLDQIKEYFVKKTDQNMLNEKNL